MLVLHALTSKSKDREESCAYILAGHWVFVPHPLKYFEKDVIHCILYELKYRTAVPDIDALRNAYLLLAL